MNLREPSREQIQKPGSEGPCPTPTRNGDNPSYPESITIGNHTLTINHSGGTTADPAPAKTGA